MGWSQKRKSGWLCSFLKFSFYFYYRGPRMWFKGSKSSTNPQSYVLLLSHFPSCRDNHLKHFSPFFWVYFSRSLNPVFWFFIVRFYVLYIHYRIINLVTFHIPSQTPLQTGNSPPFLSSYRFYLITVR